MIRLVRFRLNNCLCRPVTALKGLPLIPTSDPGGGVNGFMEIAVDVVDAEPADPAIKEKQTITLGIKTVS